MKLEAEAVAWGVDHPDLPISAFACRYPGQYKIAAEAIRFARYLDGYTEYSEDDMSQDDKASTLSAEERAKLYLAEKQAMRDHLAKTIELLAYYRELAPNNGSRAMPPAHYFVIPNKDWSYGRLRDGMLQMLGKETGSKEAAIEACWEHFDSHISDNVEKYIKREGLPKGKPSEAVHKAVDLTDMAEAEDTAEAEEPAPVSRRRRRRIVDE